VGFTDSRAYPIDGASTESILKLVGLNVERNCKRRFRRCASSAPSIAFHSPKAIKHDRMDFADTVGMAVPPQIDQMPGRAIKADRACE